MRTIITLGILLLCGGCGGCKNATPKSHYHKFLELKTQEQERKTQDKDEGVETPVVDKARSESPVPFTLYDHYGEQTYTGYNFYHNGIRYIGVFLENQSTSAAAVVDYSQFFNQDTVTVGGRTWVAVIGAPVKKEE